MGTLTEFFTDLYSWIAYCIEHRFTLHGFEQAFGSFLVLLGFFAGLALLAWLGNLFLAWLD